MLALWIFIAALAAIVGVFGAGVIVRRIWRVLPPPTTFAEGQRALYGMLGAGAGIFCGLLAIAMIALFFWGGWSKTEEHTIVVILGCTLGGFVLCMSAVIIGLLAGGPVGRFKAEAEIAGNKVGLEAGGGEQ
jgi:hypothetical protein